MKKIKGQLQNGQTILEVLLAFGISITVLGAVIFSITTSLSNTQYAKNQNLANSYAQEGMAVVRRIRDSGWSDALGSSYPSDTYCIGSDSELYPTSSSSTLCKQSNYLVGSIFSREAIITHYKDDYLSNGCAAGTPTPPPLGTGGSKVTVKVSWSDNKCASAPYCHSVELITCFSSID